MLSRLANIFRVPDLRNKVVFTLAVIALYQIGANVPVPGVNWLLEVGNKPGHDRRPILTVNNTYGMLRAIMSGLGIAALPDFVAGEQTGLVRILPEKK